MVTKVDTAVVSLWGDPVGAVSWLADRGYAVFEYDPRFLKKGLDISPIHMGVAAAQGDGLFAFPNLNNATFLGLPGLAVRPPGRRQDPHALLVRAGALRFQHGRGPCL